MNEAQGTTNLATFEWNQSSSPNSILSDSTWDYIYGPDGSPIEAFKPNTSSSQIYLLQADNNTQVIGINTSNSVAFLNKYGPWGNNASPSSTEPQIGYDGGYFDPVTHYWLFTNRLYNEGTGTFLNADPSISLINQAYDFAGSPNIIGNSSQVYTFANNDPLNYSDPSGEKGKCDNPINNPDNLELTVGKYLEKYVKGDTANKISDPERELIVKDALKNGSSFLKKALKRAKYHK
jgi:RHS repeat-associated protein